MDEKIWQERFNQGYTLQKHNPELMEKLRNALKDSQREQDQFFLSGADQYKSEELNKHLGKNRNFQIQDPTKSQGKGIDKTQDKSDKGLERE